MDSQELVRNQLIELLAGGNAHQPFDQIVADFPLEQINKQPPGLDYTPWRLLEHIRIAQVDILDFIRDPDYESPEWPAGYWPAPGAKGNLSQWDATVSAIKADRQALLEILRDPETDLFAPLPHAPDYTNLREILVVADHNAYHLGEFGLLRSILQG